VDSSLMVYQGAYKS